ncbi:MAG: phage integrase N-terminal SAM-like domain-containing protein, partial [Chloroflexi bacterium]|nr:phage integrase N-terminal SAM-like domain-containing protein [Chloroflexota bacterium]
MQTDFDSFEQWLTHHDYADLTTQSYLGSLKLFATWFEKENGEVLSPSGLTPSDLRDYREHLSRELHRAPATVNRHLAGLSTYCRWAVEKHLIESDPSANIHGLSKTRLAPHWLECKQRFALQRVIEREWQQSLQMSIRRSLWKRRDLCIVMSLLHLGLRVAELTGITLPDLT